MKPARTQRRIKAEELPEMLDDQQGLQGASAQESAMQSDGQHQLFLCIYLCTFYLNKND